MTSTTPAFPSSEELNALAGDLRRSYRDPEHGVVVVSPRLLVRAADILERIAGLGLSGLARDTVVGARDLISVAGALGMDVAAPVGSDVWIAEVMDYVAADQLGAFPSEAAAWTALRNWVLTEWGRTKNAPWDRDTSIDRVEWVTHRTDEEIVAEHRRRTYRWMATVYKLPVEAPPAALPAQ